MATSLSSLYCGQPSHALGLAAVLLTMDFIINTDLYIYMSCIYKHQFNVQISIKDIWMCEHIFGLLNINLELKSAIRKK